MKCSDTSCGLQGKGKFCEACGKKMIPDAPAEVFIICSGTLDEGVVCGAELKKSQNFCSTCGTPVDKRLFASLEDKCKRCGTVLGPDIVFCAECGLKKGTDVPLITAVERTVEKSSGCDSKSVSDTSHSTRDTLDGNTENLQDSELSKDTPEMKLEKYTEIQDSETKSIQAEELESCSSSSASECGEQADDKSTTTKKRSKGGRKAESKRKREHKSKVHAEKYNLKNEEIPELETNGKQIENVEEEKKKTPKGKEQEVSLNIEVCDETNNNSVGSQTPVFGNSRPAESNTDGNYNVIYPPDPTGPTFFSSESNLTVSHNSIKAESSLNSGNESCKHIADVPKNTDNTKGKFEENTNTAENKMQKEEKNIDEKTNMDNDRQTQAQKETDTPNVISTGGSYHIDVVFHILVPTNMIKDNRKMLVVVGAHELGGWKNRTYAFHSVKAYTDYTEMRFTLQMAKYQLQRNIKYKYALMKDTSKQSIEWEEYYVRTHADTFHNRRLYVEPQLLTNKDEWHQYDGVVIVKPSENILQKVGNWFIGKNVIDWESHPEDFAKMFCPSWFKSGFRVMDTTQTHHESIYHFECLYKGLRKMYYVDSRTFQSDDQFATRFATWILTPLSECLVRQESASVGIYVTVIRALCIVVVCEKLKLPLLDKTWQNVCRCLLVHANTANKTCAELKDILEYFPDRKYLAKALADFVKRVDRFGKNPSWMFCLPLIHFLEDTSKPFGEVTMQRNHSDKIPRWWGIVEIQSAVNSFKRNSNTWQIPLAGILATLQPSFEMDIYLPRSIIACLKPTELLEVIGEEILPVEVCCATLCCFIKSTKPSYNQGNQVSNETDVVGEEKTVVNCISKLKNRLQHYSLPTGSSRKQWWLAFMIAYECLQEAVSTNRTSKVIPSAQIFLHCVTIYQRICNQADSEEDKPESRQEGKPKELLEKACFHVLSWLNTFANEYWIIHMAKNLQVWNKAFVEELKIEEAGINWNERVAKELIGILGLQAKTVTSEFLRNYCQHYDDYSGLLQDCLNRFALKAVEGGIDLDILSLREGEKARFATLLSEMFQREWRSVDIGEQDLREERILKMVLSWSPFRQFFKSLYNNEKCSRYLSETCQDNLRSTITVLHNTVEAIATGKIKIGTLKYIQRNRNVFCEVVQDIMSDKKDITRVMPKAVDIRIREVQSFEEQADRIKTFVDLCAHFPEVRTDEIETVLQKQTDIEKYSVSEFCKTVLLTESTISENHQPNVCVFNVPDTVLRILPALKMHNNSFVFAKMWNEMCGGPGQNCATFDDIVTMVWIPVKKSWDEFVHRVDVGDVMFQEFEKMIGRIYRDDEQSMFAELKRMHIVDDHANERIEQLRQYRKLESCVSGAKVILGFARRYHLTGDFTPVSDIAAYYSKDFKMNSFDQTLVKTCEFLKDITTERTKCLVVFMNCGNLVKWLQESVHELKQLKVFVDLAFMSAGEEPISIRKVECLHSAVTGYAPLIFDLKPNTGYKELLDLCDIVWKELGANPNLPDMLVDTNREIEWLKDVEKSHGSVEVTSFAQVDAINSDGIFTVGRNVWPPSPEGKNRETEDTSLLVADDVLRLTVREQDEQRPQRDYTYSQLQDLTSRLMLVAGKAEKGNDKIEKFIMTYDGITRLCNVFTQLYAAGCVLFHGWTVQCLCDVKRPVALILKFGQGESVPLVKGRRSEQEDLKDIVPELAHFMENCLKEWLQHIKEKRKQYIHLNYFTVDQLVILQRELVKVGTRDVPSHLIYPLLSAIKQNCSPADVTEAMTRAKEEIDSQTSMVDTADADCKTNDETTADSNTDAKRKTFIEELVQSGYDEALAIKALDHIDPEDIDQGIVWCMEHDESTDDDDDSQMATKYDKPVTDATSDTSYFSGWSQSETSLETMITSSVFKLTRQKEHGSEALLQKLNLLWEEFLASITSNIRDYLSLEHLGLILRHLAAKNTVHIVRSLSPWFVEGHPNLVVCPSAEVIATTLSVYMRDIEQPLPQSDEVLMCTAATKADEVDIFLRRAILEGSRKIHCLMYADMLDYDVSEATQRRLEEYLQDAQLNKELKYRLLVICGTENEYRSTLVSSLDKYKRQPLPANFVHLREYIASKLFADTSEVTPAALIDSDRSTVRLIKSWRAGVGKTLFKKRQEEHLLSLKKVVSPSSISIMLHEKTIDMHYVFQKFLEHTPKPEEVTARLFHIDVAHEVENGVDYLLFNLLVLGCLTDKTGHVWRKSPADIYLIETMPLLMRTTNRKGTEWHYVHTMLSILPDMTCRSPLESLRIYKGTGQLGYKDSDQLFDEKLFRSAVFQRPFQYFLRLEENRPLDDVRPYTAEGTPEMCIELLLRHCGIRDPSWSEIHHFVWFLNTQLEAFEENNFASPAAAEHLPGFETFLLRFLILMSRDFATRSLNISEESPGLRRELDEGETNEQTDAENQAELQQYQMRRTWESSPHPYLFFNSDRATFTFLGFFIDQETGNLVDLQTGAVLEESIMSPDLYSVLVDNSAPLQEDFDSLKRHEKIVKLCKVMGIEMEHDPDDTYELTTDNIKKMLAIYMRFRCDIPVIIMGETGCGKTRLIKFMCSLQMPPGLQTSNMILMKVHGGTTNKDIIRKVAEAEKIAEENRKKFGPQMYTVLFFDEANTTEAIGLIKEIMCDKTVEGKKLKLCGNLKMVAACNPYRKHADELIKKLEQAGLGYHVDADETTDRLGRVPMRRLVYRVQPLPQSLLPLVWDFGQLNTKVEDLYIRQMVRRYIREDMLPNTPGLIEVVSAILTASQQYMRLQKDECSFVSLRDVDRVLLVMSWFYEQSQGERTLFNRMDAKRFVELDDPMQNSFEESIGENVQIGSVVDDLTRSLILSLGVCYHACLKARKQYRHNVARLFQKPCAVTNGDQMKVEIESCQDVFLDQVNLEKNIARNKALKENVFMMVVCIELRIPLFLVGKPGSSKSLAKTIVNDAMQGNASRGTLFRKLKQAQMVSFQCSPLSTPGGIVGTFRQCSQFQKGKNLETFVSIVVLDEVGLAEDSPRMPLKTLHPLLEDGCQGDEKPEKYKKVAFIGISNWALDPAKMNRGILVQREVPDLKELKRSARGICKTDGELGNLIRPLIEPMAKSYLEIFEKASKQMREFFGLRDFYSLVKMVFRFVEKAKRKPTWYEMLHAIKRNFGGLDEDKVDPIDSFRRYLATIDFGEESGAKPDNSPAGLIEACLFDTYQMNSESRYLLLLTENYGALAIVQQQILSRSTRPIIIFGSSFRSDQKYTQVCRNINRIKICMETGKTVVLLNLENLYESLYDALNQYYVYYGGARYVDLGLGTHRVKCPVHEEFRLIVVAEKQTVYKKFPIPLINRLEKHFLTINTMLTDEQQEIVKILEKWTTQFSEQKCVPYEQRGSEKLNTRVEDVFIGFHEDTCSSVVLHICDKNKSTNGDHDFKSKVLEEGKSVLVWCATPDAVLRLKNSNLPSEEKTLFKDLYFRKQAHDSLIHYLKQEVFGPNCRKQMFAQITTHSKLLTIAHKEHIGKATGVRAENVLLLETLSSFDTEQQFSNKIRQHLKHVDKDPSLMVIQCDSGDVNVNLIACARYCVFDEIEKMREEITAPVHAVFIVQLPRNGKFSGFQCGVWHSAHIDDLLPDNLKMPAVEDMIGRSASSLLKEAIGEDREYAEKVIDMDIENKFTEESETPVDVNDLEKTADTSHTSDDSNDYHTDESEKSVNGSDNQLQLDDVVIDLKIVDEETQQISRNKVDIKALIMSCVQAALSVVKDEEERSKRETDRVTLILKLLDHENVGNKRSFLHGICRLIVKLLEEKESQVVTGMAENWLIIEAANLDYIRKTGTLRRSCTQILENKVSPIFASIIAFLDTNGNLNLMDDIQTAWKRDLWLALLRTPEALKLQYTDVQHRGHNEVIVKTSGLEGHVFSACMPFSWLLIKQISEILQLEYPFGHGLDDSDSRAEACYRVLSKHPFNVVLNDVIQDTDEEEVVNDYIHDFVHSVYNPGSSDEHQLVCQSVAHAAKQLSVDSDGTSLLLTVINLHIAHETLASRLTYFRAIHSVWPECSSAILELKREQPDHFMFQEFEFVFPAVCMLIEKLSPQKPELEQSMGRVNWLNKVHRYRPVVEKVISLQKHQHLYGASSLQSLRKAKELWSRIVVFKLFLEHICTADKKNKITIRYCMPLWTTLSDDTDMKQMKSFGKVERFLKSCNKGALKEYIGAEEKCSHCEQVLEGLPICLPCSEVLCDECYEDVKALGKYECTKCHQVVTPGFKYERQQIEGIAQEKLKDYQRRCNTFFMDVVSQLCFADNTAPSEEVVDRLLGYVFFKTSGQNQRTRDWTIFNTGVDPNPVFRSFLLQLLIRSSKDGINKNLEAYLGQAKTLINKDPVEQDRHYIELSILIIQCLEDMFIEQANESIEHEVDVVIQALRIARQTIGDPNLCADKLYGIASARMGLAKVAKFIAKVVVDGAEAKAVSVKVRRVIEAAQNLCEDTNVRWTRIYLVKYLCRCYGVDVYRSLCRSRTTFLRWIAIKDINTEKVVEVSDRYVVCGQHYIEIREAVTKAVLGESEDLMKVLQELQTAEVGVETLFTLAVHREVTSSYLYPQQQRKLSEQVQKTLLKLIADCQALKNKETLSLLVQNKLVQEHLKNTEGECMLEQGIQCLTVHFQSVFSHLKGDKTLLEPLLTLTSRPQACVNWFLPTMPQDDLDEVKEALLAARHQNANENPVFHRCPNGHPYVIGNCGRAIEIANCRECGATIGGQRHRLTQGNTQDRGVDNTVTGHILGRAEVRGRGPQPERSLTPAYCATIRCLLHLAMFVGAGNNIQGVQTLIKPDIEEDQVEEFLWRHIQLDVDDLRRALNRSADDVFLFMHTVIDCIFRTHREEEQVRVDLCQLRTKQARFQWENHFSRRFIGDILQTIEAAMKSSNQLLAKDKRLGADPLLCLLYETDTQKETESSAQLHDIPRVWRYRTPISIQHLRQEVEAKITDAQKHKILKLFLEEEHHLRAIRYIPSVLQLHRALLSRYQKKVDKLEASSVTVDMLAQDQVAGLDTERLLQDFSQAWELVRNSLKMYLCPTELGGMAVPKEYCNMNISEKTPLSMLLPTEKEIGLCSYALLDFLMRKQNDFLDKYAKEINRESSSVSTILPREVTTAHLISYDTQHDILPLVLANCQYFFEMGKGTKIEYDFKGLERQLMDRFLFSKSRIDVGRVLKIDMMVYRTEITDTAVFKKLEDKIPQVAIDASLKAQICNDIRHLPDLCQSLANLDITIGFLKSTGGQAEQNLHEFMVKTLQMDFSVLSRKAQQVCQFQHVKSLWLLLSLQKAKTMAESDQHSTAIFESVSLEFHEDLSEEVLTALQDYLNRLTIDKLSQLVEAMHEFILLVVAVKQNMDDSDAMNTTENKVGEWLFGYLDSLDNHGIDLAVLTDFPSEVVFRHSINTWIALHKCLKVKETDMFKRF